MRLRHSRITRRNRRLQQAGGGAPAPSPSPAPQPLYGSAYAVTLQREFPTRFPRIQTQATAAGIPLQAWEGVKVTPQEREELPPQGVGTTNYIDRTGTVFNLGVIGAFLAHRALLRHLAAGNAKGEGTLIFEDDVAIPPDFHAKLAVAAAELPADWDILFLDKFRVEGKPATPHLLKLERDMTAKKNWGIWAYIVRNSAIKDRILPTMEHMLDVPDIQLNKFAHQLNFYLAQPSIVKPDPVTAPVSNVTILDRQK
jgi:GR25 family glycosyltransferase involved in LPS biosynthesis